MGGKGSKDAGVMGGKRQPTRHDASHMSAEHIKILFDEIDVKRTGTLDTDEVRRLLAKLHLPTYLAGRLVQEADTHKSGDISYDEFVVWVHRKEEEVDAVFDEIDVDKSDSLSKKEIDAWLKAHGVRASAADEDKILAMFHASPDGEISYAEVSFLACLFYLSLAPPSQRASVPAAALARHRAARVAATSLPTLDVALTRHVATGRAGGGRGLGSVARARRARVRRGLAGRSLSRE